MNWTQQKIGEWMRLIGQSKEGTTQHLVEEFMEFLQSGEPEEAADVAILLFALAYYGGFDLLKEVDKKMDINEDRRWDTPDPKTGIVRHIRREE